MALRSRRRDRWAAIFASDLKAGCADLLAVTGHTGDEPLAVPVTIPIDDSGVVLLHPEGPLDAPRVGAVLEIRRAGDDYELRLARTDGGRLVIPGLSNASEVTGLAFTVTRRGMAIEASGPGGEPVDVGVDEQAARALANALFITLRIKITKSGRG